VPDNKKVKLQACSKDQAPQRELEMSSGQSNSLQQSKSYRARQAICESTILSLAEVGYAETSINRVAAQAGFSKGAVQHHFATKEDLVSATLDRLLERAVHTSQHKNKPRSVEESLLMAWKKLINTDAYRALMEILNAARTDTQLQLRISGDLLAWGKKLDQQSMDTYESISGNDEDAIMLLNMSRSFFRGLLIQERYGSNTASTEKYVNKWIELIAPLLRLRESTQEL